MTHEELTDEIIELLPVRLWELLEDADKYRENVLSFVQSALAERTEQCAKICDEIIKEREEVQGKVQAPLNKSGIDFQVIILACASAKIRALNQPEKKS